METRTVPELAVVVPWNVMFLEIRKSTLLESVYINNLPHRSSPPSLSDDKVTSAGELHRVAIVGRLEVDIATGLVVLVVVLSTSKIMGAKFEVGCVTIGFSSWGSEGTCER